MSKATDSCVGFPAPTALSFFTGTVSVFLAIATIPGNFLVCLAVLKDPFHELRTPFNYLLFSLAAADLIVGIVMDPISAAFHFGEGLKLDLLDIRVLHILYFILCTASILTLAALSVDRYYAVMTPLRYKTKLTPRRAFLASFVIWVVALSASMAYFKLGFILYSFIFANTSVLFTTAVLCFVYTNIYRRLRMQIKTWGRRQATTVEERSKQKQKLQNMKIERKATKSLVLVLLTFILCFTPACFMIYILKFCTKCNCILIHWLRDLQFVIVLLNSGINPFLYAWRMPQFKRALRKFLGLRPSRQVDNLSLD